MGNCQAAEAATVVVQHPGGRVERLYWATSAAEVMRANPGHYVALVTLQHAEPEEKRPHPRNHQQEGSSHGEQQQQQRGGGTVRLTRVKLLKPRDTLLLGHAYRLIAVDEVTKALQARKEEKTRKAQQQQQLESKQAGVRIGYTGHGDGQAHLDPSHDQSPQQDRDSHQSGSATSHSRHPRQWRPSLHSIAEVSS